MTNPFEGTWTYRSFYNDPEFVDTFDKIALAQAELVLREAGPDWLAGKLGGEGWSLEMTGISELVGGRWQLRMRATGARDSSTYGWIYDYVGALAFEWPGADRQVPAIVGTVTRTVFHEPRRRAGESFSFVAVRKENATPSVKPLPENVLGHFADREHRLHHAVWHTLRNFWYDLREDQREAIVHLDWAPPRPARMNANDIVRPLILNGSGEDFLYFHREMVCMFRDLMSAAGESTINWPTVPQPGTEGEEVPPAWPIPDPTLERRIRALKTDEFYWSRMRWWDQQFKDPTYLASLTLGQLGALLEYSIHNDMHMRWSAPPRDPFTNALLPTGRDPKDTDPRWDDPRYDWLGDFYSSHVNPFFWRLHGWVDDRVNDWFDAQAALHPGEVEKFRVNGWTWFKRGKWVQVEQPWVWPAALQGGSSHMHGQHTSDEHSGHNGDHGSDPDLRQKRIDSLEAVLDAIFDRRPKTGAVSRAEHKFATDTKPVRPRISSLFV